MILDKFQKFKSKIRSCSKVTNKNMIALHHSLCLDKKDSGLDNSLGYFLW